MRPPDFKKVIYNIFVEPRSSAIHGQGLFAKRRIPKETQIIEYLGEKLGKEESNERGLERLEKSKNDGTGAVYIFDVNEDFDIDGNFPWNIARLANHSCDPNCEVVNIDDHIWVVALRTIEKGEEITYDYGYDIEHFEDHPCRCGTSKCVGYIVRKDQRRKLKRVLRDRQNARTGKKTTASRKKTTR